jgi:hypothetical protein
MVDIIIRWKQVLRVTAYQDVRLDFSYDARDSQPCFQSWHQTTVEKIEKMYILDTKSGSRGTLFIFTARGKFYWVDPGIICTFIATGQQTITDPVTC